MESLRAPKPLLDRQRLERLERLSLRWNRSFRGVLGGNNVSRYAGVGHEFLDHRNFYPGDDLRAVNWRTYLRLDRLFLKLFCTEPRTPVRILLDRSESMALGEPESGSGEPKWTAACRLTAALCYVGLVRLESLHVIPFADKLSEGYRVQGGRSRYAGVADFLCEIDTAGETDLLAVTSQLLARRPAPGLLLVISDFLDRSDPVRALQHLADFGNELVLIHIAGPEEREPPWRGEIEAVDAETGNVVPISWDEQNQREHARAYDAFCDSLAYTAARNRGRYLSLTTDVSLEDALYGSLVPREAISVG